MSKIVVSLDELLDSGAHFGHQTRRWNPKMEEYLFGSENGVHIFDLTKVKPLIEEALDFITRSVKEGKTVLLLGTKKQVKDKVAEVAEKVGIPYVNERWLGGTISNFPQMQRSLKKMEEMKEKYGTVAQVFPLPDPGLTGPGVVIKPHKDADKAWRLILKTWKIPNFRLERGAY